MGQRARHGSEAARGRPWFAAARRRVGPEDGFSIVEMVVAMALLALSMLALAGTLGSRTSRRSP